MMKKSRFTETQIVNILKLTDSDMKFDDIRRQNESSSVTTYRFSCPPVSKY